MTNIQSRLYDHITYDQLLWGTTNHGVTARSVIFPLQHEISLSGFSFPSMLAPMTVSGSAPAMARNEADSVWEAVSQLFGKIACFLLFLHQACVFSCNKPPARLAE